MKVLGNESNPLQEMEKEEYKNTEAFKLINIDGIIELSDTHGYFDWLVKASAEARIERTEIITTARSRSFDGQIITGRKLLVEGTIILKLQYVVGNASRSISNIELEEPFSNHIVLAPDTNEDVKIKAGCRVENIHISKIGKRKLFKSIILLLTAARQDIYADSEKSIGFSCKYDRNLTDSNLNSRTQLIAFEKICLPDKRPDIRGVESFLIEPEILNVVSFDTYTGISFEGQQLTGKCCLMEVGLKYKLLYCPDEPSQSLHGIDGQWNKSLYIVVPQQIKGYDFETMLKHKLVKASVNIRQAMAYPGSSREIYCFFVIDGDINRIPTYEICSTYKKGNHSGLRIMFDDGTNSNLLLLEKDCEMRKPQWSPLGHEICYKCKYEDRDILRLINVRTLRTKDVVAFEGEERLGNYCWVDKGRKLVFSALSRGVRELYLIDLMTMKFKQITDGKLVVNSYKPKASEDGSYIAYIKSTGQLKNLWLMDICNFKQIKLTEEGGVRDFTWSYDRRYIAYTTRKGMEKDRILLVDVVNGKSKPVFERGYFHKINSIAIAPDGKYITFVGINGETEDIYMLELSSSKMKCVTDNVPGVNVKNLVWGLDSQGVYYASNLLGYYNIFWCSVDGLRRGQITNIAASKLELSYRHKVE